MVGGVGSEGTNSFVPVVAQRVVHEELLVLLARLLLLVVASDPWRLPNGKHACEFGLTQFALIVFDIPIAHQTGPPLFYC